MPELAADLHLIKLFKKLGEIGDACHSAINSREIDDQQKRRLSIKKLEESFVNLIDKYKDEALIDAKQHYILLEGLLSVTYDYYKIATRQSFGEFEQPKVLPKYHVKEDDLIRLAEKNTVISANQTQKARLKESGELVFCKNTIPAVAQLEIVAADFYRQMLDGRTAQGKVIVDNDGIAGMYVEAIPGFISMRQLTELAEHPYPYVKVSEEMSSIRLKIARLEKQISSTDDVVMLRQLESEVQERTNLLNAYESIKDKRLIDPGSHTVNLSNLSDVMAKALCSAFFCQDWDRHKENFGISFKKEGGLGVASLDYDKSLSGIFGQDNKAYDWEITPTFLRNFPEFECWYWPTSSNRFRKMFGSLVAKHKTPKMYSEKEAAQYSKLKNDKEFQKHAQREWLKLIFIPKELRERSVAVLASDDCDQRLKDTPNILEKRRQELLDSLVQVNSFRENFKDPALLESVKEELKINLDFEEMKIVQDNWESIRSEIDAKIALIEAREDKVSSMGLHLLNAAVATSGVSYSLSVSDDDFVNVLSKIDVHQTSKELKRMLNDKLGLSITEDDARKIKEELYLKKIIDNVKGLGDIIKPELLENISIHHKHSWMEGGTLKEIKSFESSISKYVETHDLKHLEKATKSLRSLGINPDLISDDKFKELVDKQLFSVDAKTVDLGY